MAKPYPRHFGNPNDLSDARWYPRADVSRKWAITRAAPICQMIAAGSNWGFTSSFEPPKAMIGQRIGLHCGVSSVKHDWISDRARAEIASLTGQTIENWNLGLREMKAEAGQIVGSAVLVAGFRCDGPRETECVHAMMGEIHSHEYLGDWIGHHGLRSRRVGDWSKGRWVWAFGTPKLVKPEARPDPIPGAGGGLWDVAIQLRNHTHKTTQREDAA
jgi:hypothetical protein